MENELRFAQGLIAPNASVVVQFEVARANYDAPASRPKPSIFNGPSTYFVHFLIEAQAPRRDRRAHE
ncbi:MAG: hypothetical protein ABSE69_07515 [Roseiarcus sp.]